MVGLFGGSFDPPHVAHLIIAEAVRDQFDLDEVVWIPAYRAPHKLESGHSSAEHRLEMVRLATAENPHFTVSDVELHRRGVSYTIDTLTELQERRSGTAFALILGGDSLAGFPTWHKPQEILNRVPLIVYQRGGEETAQLQPPLHGTVHLARAPLLEISSTAIRRRRRRGQSIRYLVTETVRAYIEAQGLYLT